MDNKKVAKELVKIAKLMLAKARGPVWDALKKKWNALHDIETELDMAASKYDIAASYRDFDGYKDAEKIVDMIEKVKKELEDISMDKFGKLVNAETKFVMKHGTPEEYSNKARSKMFPASIKTPKGESNG